MAWPIMQKGCYGGRAGKSMKAVEEAMVQFENSQGLSLRSAALSREESAVSPLAASGFLADKAGFGMTKGESAREELSFAGVEFAAAGELPEGPLASLRRARRGTTYRSSGDGIF
jgi:hypothetical protein